jgi:simple sugar transport system ATP-binding protein
MSSTAALELLGVSKRFGEVLALDGASLAVRAGSVHAVLGENGAGKSTLMRVAFGLVRADGGTVRVHGADRDVRSPADAIAAGIGMVHQHFAIVPAMTVAENVALGGTGRFDPARAESVVARIGAETGLALDPRAIAGTLSVGAQQRLEIVKALARDARLLILDEPTAVLAPGEIAELLRWVRAFADSGRTAVLITHKLREVLAVADDVTVLRRGRTVAAFRASGTSEAALADAMLGGVPPRLHDVDADVAAHHQRASSAIIAPSASAVLRADAVTVTDERGVERVRAATLDVAAGEIVGIAAVEGSGQRELLRALAGRLPVRAGRVVVPPDVGFVPEDRHQDALVLDFPLTENVLLRRAGRLRGLIAWSTERQRTSALLTNHDVRADGPTAIARTLSGGNQQKLVLARELEGAPAALVVENPTRGLDLVAAAAVHRRLRAARDAGCAILLYSSDLDEVLALADRVVVVYAGTVRETPRDREAVGRAMLGAP